MFSASGTVGALFAAIIMLIGLIMPPSCCGLTAPMPTTEIPYGVTTWDWQAFIHRHTLDGYSSVAAEVDANAVQAFNVIRSVQGTRFHPVGTCCDGCSVVVILLKQKNPAPGDIRFTITGPAGGFPATGSISSTFPEVPAPQTAVAGELTTVVVPSTQYTVAFYRPPASYLGATNGSAMASNGWPSVAITLTDSAGFVLGAAQLTLRPPPVLFVHGLDSGPGTWGYPPPVGAGRNTSAYTFFTSLDVNAGEEIGVANYSSQNTSGLATVMPTVLENLRSLIDTSRENQIEDTQADAVCHSYGGLICKCLAENAENLIVQRPDGFPQFVWSAAYHGPGTEDTHYLRDDNDDLGYLDRVVTLGSPLDGSPVASFLMGTLQTNFGAGGYAVVLELLSKANLVGNGDALSDLATQNAVIQALAARPAVAWRPIVITMAPQTQQQLDSDLAGGYWIVEVFTKFVAGANWANLGLTPTASDGVVPIASQTDSGYANDVKFKVTVGGLFHTQEPGSPSIWQRAADLLELDNTGVVSGSYTMFKPQF